MPVTAASILIFTSVLLTGLWIWACFVASSQLPVDVKGKLRRLSLAMIIGWLAILTAVGKSGIIADFNRFPPPFLFFLLAILIGCTLVGTSRLGLLLIENIDLRFLVGYQSFRILAEFAIIQAYHEGLAPVQMSFEGLNFDIITGISALIILCFRQVPVWIITIWNILGFTLLTIVVSVAFLSAPTPFRYFMNEPANIWVTGFPYILLPGMLVFAALLGHILIFRALLRTDTLLRVDSGAGA